MERPHYEKRQLDGLTPDTISRTVEVRRAGQGGSLYWPNSPEIPLTCGEASGKNPWSRWRMTERILRAEGPRAESGFPVEFPKPSLNLCGEGFYFFWRRELPTGSPREMRDG